MARPKQDFGKSTNDNMIIRVGPLSLNKRLSKIVCEGLSLRPLVMRTVTGFISLTAPKIESRLLRRFNHFSRR